MPSFSKGNDGLDKEYFEELQEKCRFLGISLKEKDFRKNPDLCVIRFLLSVITLVATVISIA